jgi:hypothetical protein
MVKVGQEELINNYECLECATPRREDMVISYADPVLPDQLKQQMM